MDYPHETRPDETPVEDISGLKIRSIVTQHELNEYEAANLVDCTAKYLSKHPEERMAPFTLNWCKILHQQMLGDVWRWAGQFRKTQTNLGLPPHQIEQAVYNLLNDLQQWKNTGMDWILQSAMLHHGAVWIHPFTNGNGRWARLLTNIWLAQHHQPVIKWPEVNLALPGNERDQYLVAIKAADNGKYSHLCELHCRYQCNE